MPYEVVDFAEIPGVPCPCGTARRAFADVPGFPATFHVTEISADAALHYHKRLTEVYYFLECGPGAQMQLDGEIRARETRHVHPDPTRSAPPRHRQDEGGHRGQPEVRPQRRMAGLKEKETSHEIDSPSTECICNPHRRTGNRRVTQNAQSPSADTTMKVGGKDVTIEYNAPSARGRKVEGGLIPYGEVWRLGADSATTLTTDTNLKIGDLAVPKGVYTLYIAASRGRLEAGGQQAERPVGHRV